MHLHQYTNSFLNNSHLQEHLSSYFFQGIPVCSHASWDIPALHCALCLQISTKSGTPRWQTPKRNPHQEPDPPQRAPFSTCSSFSLRFFQITELLQESWRERPASLQRNLISLDCVLDPIPSFSTRSW